MTVFSCLSEFDHPLRLRIRQSAKQNRLHRTEHRRIHSDAEREYDHRSGGERRCLRQDAPAKASVLTELLDCVPPPRSAAVLLLQGRVAELPAGECPRFFLTMTLFAELIDFFGKMFGYLIGHLAVDPPFLQPPGYGVHDSTGLMTRPIPANKRSNPAISRSSCLRPAGVSL